jgi:hypothetical protein
MDAGIWFVRFDVHDYQIPDLLACAPRSVLDGLGVWSLVLVAMISRY